MFSMGLTAQSFERVWATDTILKTPESVMYDAVRKQIYVSNINGNPSEKDINGFISLLNADGSMKSLRWVSGMNGPKGMALVDNLLYVTDIDRIHIIDVDQGKIIKTADVEGSTFLNDIAVIAKDKLIISDSRNNQLFIFDGNRASVWLENELLISPNGLAFYDNLLFVGTKNNLLAVDPDSQKLQIFISNTGPIDGLIPLGSDKFIISDWSGKIQLITADTKTELQNTSEQEIQAADLGFISEESLVLIPTFFNNRVVVKKINIPNI